jgi:hypothetical protein
MQALAFDYDNQDPLLESEHAIKEPSRLKVSRVQPSSGRNVNRLPYNLQFAKEIFRNSVKPL